MTRFVAVLVLALFGCAPNASELITAGQWSGHARLACVASLDLCPAAIVCSGSVLALASEGATRSSVPVTAKACVLPSAPLGSRLINIAGLAGAVEVVADVVAEQLRERAAARLAVRDQALSDLSAERARAGIAANQ